MAAGNVKSLNIIKNPLKVGEVFEEVVLPNDIEEKLEQINAQYPEKRSAIMPALYLAQEHYGYISKPAIAWVSSRIGVSPVEVMEVATFYTMYYKAPVGKYHVQICRTLSCAVLGAKTLAGYLRERLKVDAHTVSSDGLWSFEEVECLGSCGTGPMAQINDVFFENLTPEKLGEVMDRIEIEQPNLRLSGIDETLSTLTGAPFSEII